MLIWTELVCDRCASSTAGEFAHWGKRGAKEVKETLRQEGWIYINGQLFCRNCKIELGVENLLRV